MLFIPSKVVGIGILSRCMYGISVLVHLKVANILRFHQQFFLLLKHNFFVVLNRSIYFILLKNNNWFTVTTTLTNFILASKCLVLILIAFFRCLVTSINSFVTCLIWTQMHVWRIPKGVYRWTLPQLGHFVWIRTHKIMKKKKNYLDFSISLRS